MLHLVTLRLLETYFRHRWMYLIPVPILLAAAIVSFVTTKPSYLAHGTLWVERQSLLATLTSVRADGISWITPAEATVDEFDELLHTDSFVRAVIKQTDLETEMSKSLADQATLFEDVRKWVWVQTLGNNVVTVNAAHEQGKLAQQLSTAAIEAYLTWRINNDRQDSLTAQSFFGDLITAYKKDLDKARAELQTYLEAHPDPVRGDRPSTEMLQIDKLQLAIKDAADRVQKAVDNQENSRLALVRAENDVRQKYLVVDQPVLPGDPEVSKKKLIMNMVIFGVVGLMLSVVVLVGATLLDKSLHFQVDVLHGLGLPMLASIPSINTGKSEKPARRAKKPAKS
jgi:capsular polysaccharide biosynthesis protein